MSKRVVLAYSGGLDTSVAVRWLGEERGLAGIALAADVGLGGDFDDIRNRALAAGAVEAVVADCREEYARDFVAPTLKANAKYEGKYPLISSLSRPLIAKHLVAAAREARVVTSDADPYCPGGAIERPAALGRARCLVGHSGAGRCRPKRALRRADQRGAGHHAQPARRTGLRARGNEPGYRSDLGLDRSKLQRGCWQQR